MSKIKICGVTRIVDAEAVIEAGADYMGLIFADSSPRKLRLEQAAEIASAAKGKITLVGVFKDQPLGFVQECIRKVPLDMVQLHGAESPDYCRSLGVAVIKAFFVDSRFDWAQLEGYSTVHAFLFDRPKGNTDAGWLEAMISELSGRQFVKPFVFAGGLNSANVANVIKQLNPLAVDVASGVEQAPGIKDSQKLREFCTAVRKVEEDAAIR